MLYISTVQTLDYLCKRDAEWRKMARKFAGANHEDVLHEAYLKLADRFESADDLTSHHPNQVAMYVYLTIRSVYLNKRDKIALDAEVPEEAQDTYDTDQDTKDQYHIDLLLDEIESWYWFDREVFKLHYFKGYKQRQIARETNISLSTIHNTIKTCKEKLCIKASQMSTTKG